MKCSLSQQQRQPFNHEQRPPVVQRQRDGRGRLLDVTRDAHGRLVSVALPQRTVHGHLTSMDIDLETAVNISASASDFCAPAAGPASTLVQRAANGMTYCVCDFGRDGGVHVTDVSQAIRLAMRQEPVLPASLGDVLFTSCDQANQCGSVSSAGVHVPQPCCAPGYGGPNPTRMQGSPGHDLRCAQVVQCAMGEAARGQRAEGATSRRTAKHKARRLLFALERRQP